MQERERLGKEQKQLKIKIDKVREKENEDAEGKLCVTGAVQNLLAG